MESGAILIYLADKTGKLLPNSGEARYRTIEWLMWQMGGIGPMLGQTHHFVKYNKGKAPYAEERFLKEAHRLYGVLESRLAQGMGSDAAAPWLILLCTARRQSRELRAMRITWVMACEEDDQDEAEGATPGFSA